MPPNSIIVGVDLAPIKPIPGTITFQGDITTEKCRSTIRQHLKTWKADTVLHDGAPNVGTAWVQDAFSQAELALQALKLATQFLIEGGTFITKVFRSRDYNSLVWVFTQLFDQVEATKPPSSRTVSAEMFVVCRGFKAPKRIDPRFLDARSVFAELAKPTPNNEAKVFNPERKKRKREGYDEGDYIQFKEAPASEFIQTTDPIAILGSLNKFSFKQEANGDVALAALDRLPETTEEIRQCCKDLKVLGRKEFRLLLRWRLRVREIFGFASKKTTNEASKGEEVAEVVPLDNDLQLQKDLQDLHETENSRRKREKRRENEKRQKEIVRMQMHMTTPMEIGLEQKGANGEDSMFALTGIDKAGIVDRVAKGKMGVQLPARESVEHEDDSDELSDEEEDRLDDELDVLYTRYQEHKANVDPKSRAKKGRKEDNDGDWEGFPGYRNEHDSDEVFEHDQSSDDSSIEEEESGDSGNLLYPRNTLARNQHGLTSRAAMFFEQDIFKEINEDQDADSAVSWENDDAGEDEVVPEKNNEPTIRPFETSKSPSAAPSKSAGTRTYQYLEDAVKDVAEEDGEAIEINEQDNAESNFEIVKAANNDWASPGEPQKNGRLDIDLITAEAMTLAQQVASGQKFTQDLVDEGFNKFSFRDTDGLPEWFLDDEGRHSKPQRPITAAGAAAIKEKLRALNARPIKKVREAKDRKKFKAAQRLEKLRKKSALVADDDGISEKDKAQNIARLMSRATKKKPKQQVKLVVARGGNRGISGRPRGVKGKYKIVDARLKKDARAEKRLAKKKR